MDDEDGWQLFEKPPKRLKTTCFSNCIFCQKSNDVLRVAQPSSIEKVISALNIRQDELSQRLSSNDLHHIDGNDVLWHSSCYETYTSRHNLQYCLSRPLSDDHHQEPRTRHTLISFDWSKCIFCKNATRKKEKQLLRISTFEACNSIKQSAVAREDTELLSILNSVNYDLIASEGRYHKSCHASYTSKVNIKRKRESATPREENIFDEAFHQLLQVITPEIENGKAYDMNVLLMMFRKEIEKKGNEADSYTKQKLKARLITHFKQELVFHQPPQQSKPEVVYSSSISLMDAINAASSCAPSDSERSMSAAETEPIACEFLDIFSVAFRIRHEIMKCKGIDINPLNIEDLQLDTAKRLLPQSLYWLIRWIVTGEPLGDHTIASAPNITDERKIIMVGQDLIHCASHARVKLPKQVGLAMCVKHLTGSKQLITLLNRMGHCSSYEEIAQVETSLANESLARSDYSGVLIPTNINPGAFIQMAADNNDINEETIDGKNTTHATTLAIYQRQQYGPMPARVVRANHSKRRRSLDSTRELVVIEDVNVGGRRPNLADFVGKDVITWFQSDRQILSTCIDDVCWMLLRLSDPFMLCNQQKPEEQTTPGWSGFNTLTYPSIPVKTMIGYHPMIHAEASNFSTLYTLMKLAQKICESTGQRDSVITFDLDLYAKAKQLQMRYPNEFKDTVIRMGGFHIALNYLALLGKKYAQSGLEDLLIESGVYVAGTTSVLMLGKSYNRGIRAHKLSMEALFRLLWQAFLEWLSKQDNGLDDRTKHVVVGKSSDCRTTVKNKEFSKDDWMDFLSCVEPLTSLLEAFRSDGREKSKAFCFWDDYINMVLVLLQFIKAERTGNWKLHLTATAAMVPHFFSMDRINYARWLPVYLSDMNMLETSHPEVYKEFINGNHSVSHSKQPFAEVWTDMALE